jgi:hypothetical protein
MQARFPSVWNPDWTRHGEAATVEVSGESPVDYRVPQGAAAIVTDP